MSNLAKIPQKGVPVAILTTVKRLFHRFLTRRLWWDDLWALVALASDIALSSAYLASYLRVGKEKIVDPKIPGVIPTGSRLAIRWLTLMFYTTTLWTARITVAVTIVRLLPRGPAQRVAKGASILFGVMALGIILQKVAACTPKQARIGRCSSIKNYTVYTAVLELVTDGIADLWLILAPAYILLNMKLQRSHKRLVLAIFLCGIFTSLASIAHAVFLFISSPLWVIITGHIQATTAIIVSNLLVVVTYIYRVFRNMGNNPEATESSETSAETDTSSEGSSEQSSPGTRRDGYATSNATPISPTRQTTTLQLTDVSYLASTNNASASTGMSNSPSTNTQNVYRSAAFSSFSYPSYLRTLSAPVVL